MTLIRVGFGGGWGVKGWKDGAKVAIAKSEKEKVESRYAILEVANTSCATDKAENPEDRLGERANLVERLVLKQRRLKSELIERDAPKDQVKVIDERITKLMAGLNQRMKGLRQDAR